MFFSLLLINNSEKIYHSLETSWRLWWSITNNKPMMHSDEQALLIVLYCKLDRNCPSTTSWMYHNSQPNCLVLCCISRIDLAQQHQAIAVHTLLTILFMSGAFICLLSWTRLWIERKTGWKKHDNPHVTTCHTHQRVWVKTIPHILGICALFFINCTPCLKKEWLRLLNRRHLVRTSRPIAFFC